MKTFCIIPLNDKVPYYFTIMCIIFHNYKMGLKARIKPASSGSQPDVISLYDLRELSLNPLRY